jgi:hypothetical protein
MTPWVGWAMQTSDTLPIALTHDGIPAQAGTQVEFTSRCVWPWVPAFAGMTVWWGMEKLLSCLARGPPKPNNPAHSP